MEDRMRFSVKHVLAFISEDQLIAVILNRQTIPTKTDYKVMGAL